MAEVTPSLSCLTPTASHSSTSSSCCTFAKTVDAATNDTFPAGLRVLVVDDDPICLLILDRMLRHCQYQVTTCGKATEALAMLRENRNSFDVILSDVYMPDMDGFKLLELVGLEMDLPVIMMSANGETSAVMKGIIHGACDYLLKPVRMEELRNIWQHVVRKKWRSSGQTSSHEVDKVRQAVDDVEHTSSANDEHDDTWRQNKKRKDLKEVEDEIDLESDDPSSTTKKPRVVWSVELHQQFVNAVNQLGIDKAVPKRILELMNAQGLTRENVASHLQKYRLYLKRISGVGHHSVGGLNHPFPVGIDASFGSVSVAGSAGINEHQNFAGPSSSALLLSLQSADLGRLNSANLGLANLDPSVLLRMAALEGRGNEHFRRPLPLPSAVQPVMNEQRSFQVGPSNLNQIHASQLGAFTGSLDKAQPRLLALQQQQQLQHQQQEQQRRQLAAMAKLDELEQITGVGSNHSIASLKNAPLLLQTLHQQHSSGHLKSSRKGSLRVPTNASRGGMHTLPPDMVHQVAALPTSNICSMRSLSVPSLANLATALTPINRATDFDSRDALIPNAGNVAATTVSSQSISSRLDDLGGGGMKEEQQIYSGQKIRGPWQSLDVSREQFHDPQIQSPVYSLSFSGGQNLMAGMGQDQGQQAFVPTFSTGFSGSTMDTAQLKLFQTKSLHADIPRGSEGNSKVKEGGNLWLPEPLSDEVLNLLLKQQERLGLAESEIGADGYAMDSMYVK